MAAVALGSDGSAGFYGGGADAFASGQLRCCCCWNGNGGGGHVVAFAESGFSGGGKGEAGVEFMGLG